MTYVNANKSTLSHIALAHADLQSAHRRLSTVHERMQGDHRYQHACNDLRRLLGDVTAIANQLSIMHEEDAGLIAGVGKP